jgi:hypothetical protein
MKSLRSCWHVFFCVLLLLLPISTDMLVFLPIFLSLNTRTLFLMSSSIIHERHDGYKRHRKKKAKAKRRITPAKGRDVSRQTSAQTPNKWRCRNRRRRRHLRQQQAEGGKPNTFLLMFMFRDYCLESNKVIHRKAVGWKLKWMIWLFRSEFLGTHTSPK